MSTGHSLDAFTRSLQDAGRTDAALRDAPSAQQLHPFLTTWMITFGTHAARLHGDARPTVDRHHNQRGEAFIDRDPARFERIVRSLKADPVALTVEQCTFIEQAIPAIIERGGWSLRAWAAPPPPRDGDHVHVLLDARPQNDPAVILALIKRWLTQALNTRWPPDRSRFRGWWAERGSSRPVKNESYLNNAYRYVMRQRATPFPSEPARPRAGGASQSSTS